MSGREFGTAAPIAPFAPIAPAAAFAPIGAAAPAPLSARAAWQSLHEAASERYRVGGRFAWHFARGKLGRDPVFRALLEGGAFEPGARVLDIGCGQALLASLLAQCEVLSDAGCWPTAWGAAPTGTHYTGIDLMPRDIACAQRALAGLPMRPRFVCGDLCQLAFESCDVVVALDVLHYMDEAAQDDVLLRIRRALAPRGRLLLRVGDASRTLRFAFSRWIDLAVVRLRGRLAPVVWGRSLAQWRAALEALQFRVEPVPMSRGTPFANVLLVCELEPASR